MAKKFYAVKEGKNVGIFTTWNECEEAVKGYPNASYKGFSTEREAREYLGMPLPLEIIKPDKTTAIAYVDGSFNPKTKTYGYGVFFQNDKSTFKGSGNKTEYQSMRNVSGEILGACAAILVAIKKGYKKIIIHYDYEGIEKWANGIWKTNKKGTQLYKEFIKEKRKLIEVEFVKVKAHSGIEYNEIVDKLAKEACGVEV